MSGGGVEGDGEAEGVEPADVVADGTVGADMAGEEVGAEVDEGMADVIAASVPGVRQIVVPDAGHMINMEAPGTVNHILTETLLTLHR